MRLLAALTILCCAPHLLAAPTLKRITPAEAMPHRRDYAHMWWANGWDHSKRTLASPKLLCFETGWYAIALNVETLAVPHFGPKRRAHDYDEVPLHAPTFSKLPAAELSMEIEQNGRRYRAARAVHDTSDWLNYPARIIDSGRFVQRADILHVEFEDGARTKLPTRGRLEIIAWPDRLTFWLDLTNAAAIRWS